MIFSIQWEASKDKSRVVLHGRIFLIGKLL